MGSNFGTIVYMYKSLCKKAQESPCILLLELSGEDTRGPRIGLTGQWDLWEKCLHSFILSF